MYDYPDKETGRPVGIIQHKAVIRCIRPGEEKGWIQMVPTPGMRTVEAWFFNQAEKCKEVMVPMDIGGNPGDDDYAQKVGGAGLETCGPSFPIPNPCPDLDSRLPKRRTRRPI